MDIQYTPPVQIAEVFPPEPFKKDPNKFKYAIKDTDGKNYTIFSEPLYDSAKTYFAHNTVVTIKYTPGAPNPNGGTYRPVVQGFEEQTGNTPQILSTTVPAPPQTHEVVPQAVSRENKGSGASEAQILRSVALKAAATARGAEWEMVVKKMEAYLKTGNVSGITDDELNF